MYRRPPHPIPPPHLIPSGPIPTLCPRQRRRSAGARRRSRRADRLHLMARRDGRDGRDSEPLLSEPTSGTAPARSGCASATSGARAHAPPLRRAALRLGVLVPRRRFAPRGPGRARRRARAARRRPRRPRRRLRRAALLQAARAAGSKRWWARRSRFDAPSGRHVERARAWQAPAEPRHAASRRVRARNAGALHAPGATAPATGTSAGCSRRRAGQAQGRGARAGKRSPRTPRGCGPDRRRRGAARARARAQGGRRAARASSTGCAGSSPAASRRAPAPRPARGGAQPGAGRARPRAAPAARGHQRRALRARAREAALRRPHRIRHAPRLDAAGALLAAQRRAAPEGRRRDGALFADLPEAVAARSSSPRASTSPSPTSATASPTTPLPPGESPAPTCASSSGTERAPASVRSPRARRRSSSASWR